MRVRQRLHVFRREVECVFDLVYEYAPVSDRKYPHRVSNPLPGWGRVYFGAECPRCKAVTEAGIQNNTVRPWRCVCKCGYSLYVENDVYPSFKLRAGG
jgi:hypothetical protein